MTPLKNADQYLCEQRIRDLTAERDALTAELERARPLLEAAVKYDAAGKPSAHFKEPHLTQTRIISSGIELEAAAHAYAQAMGHTRIWPGWL